MIRGNNDQRLQIFHRQTGHGVPHDDVAREADLTVSLFLGETQLVERDMAHRSADHGMDEDLHLLCFSLVLQSRLERGLVHTRQPGMDLGKVRLEYGLQDVRRGQRRCICQCSRIICSASLCWRFCGYRNSISTIQGYFPLTIQRHSGQRTGAAVPTDAIDGVCNEQRSMIYASPRLNPCSCSCSCWRTCLTIVIEQNSLQNLCKISVVLRVDI